jgi:ubiquinol-cytochrome c reductase cytochrome c subunit
MSKFLLVVLLLLPVLVKAQGNAENGKRLFVKNGCYQCHGYAGQGGGAGAKLAPRPLPLAALIAYVRHPAPGGMPIYSPKVMSDAELTDVWAYLKSIPDAPPAKSIPLLSQ